MALPAWAAGAWARVEPIAERLAVWRGYEQELQTLAIYGIGIALYTALVFAFYQNLSKRRPFHFRASDRPGWRGRLSRTTERALVFPVTSFLYFSVLATSLFVLAKTQSVQQILLIAMGVVVAVRVTVYVSEAMSNDLSKLVPLSLLGVLLVDPGYLTLKLAWARLMEAATLAPLLARYFLLFIALEAVMGVLRWGILQGISRWHSMRGRPRAPEPEGSVTLEIIENDPVREAPPRSSP